LSLGSKIGLALITYNRPDYYSQTLAQLNQFKWGGADVKVVVEDFSGNVGYDAVHSTLASDVSVIRNPINLTVGPTKNVALKYLMQKECSHIFLIEDDILIKNSNVCEEYVSAAKKAKVQHMNYALHGPLNKGQTRVINWRGSPVTCYPHIVGAFSYYTRGCIRQVGYIDPFFRNAWEHVEHTFRIAKEGLTTPFWAFADHPNSFVLLDEIPTSISNSSITDNRQAVQDGANYWFKKHGSWLFDAQGRCVPQ
jgi:GT2 family glycosyltransferase